MTAHEALN